MNFHKAPLLQLLLMLLFTASSLPTLAASIAEPPLVVHGKVFKLGAGGRYQLFSGNLRVKLVNSLDTTHVIDLDIPLRQVGATGEFSYRTEITQETEPPADQLASTLVISHLPITYTIQSATVNGASAGLLDPSQVAHLTTSFASRGGELRLDFKTDLPLPDTDADGIPDWWESRYGLNPLASHDAALDPDGDGLNNLKEFLNATDPNTANTAPSLQDSLLVVTAGGSAGIYLPIIDTDSPAANLRLTLLDQAAGLIWRLGSDLLPAGTEFSYSDVLAGKLSVEVAVGFQNAPVRLQIKDLSSPALPAAVSALQVEAFSPDQRWLGAPDVWLDAGSVARSGPVEEWPDRSANRRDGYQPFDTERPLADGLGSLAFNASKYLYLDDHEIQLGQFTTFMAFELGGETATDQTLFSSSDLEVSIGGPESGIHGRSLKVLQNGRTIHGPVVSINQAVQLTLNSTTDSSALHLPGQGRFRSHAGDDSPLSSFTTLGARQPFSAPASENFLNGTLREVLIYNRSLLPEVQSLIEDYQMSRWQKVRVWNYRSSTLPVMIAGAGGLSNSISGGEGNDHLTGADLADTLRGGMGNNRLTGKNGADHFRFSKTGSNDVITDFSASGGDTIDLTEIFAGKSGLPSQYVKVKTLVTRGADNAPRVDTRLELIHEGIGSIANQTITLEGVGFGSSDLPRLLGEGNLQLGGPRYDSSINLTISAADPASPGGPRKLTVLRRGNASAAIRVPLSLGGSARIDEDYQIVGAQGTGAVRSVSLARGATQAVFDLVPMPDRTAATTHLSITALPVAQTSDGGAALNFTLEGISTLAIQTLRNIHSQPSLTGLVKVTRTGSLDQALDVALVTGGTLVSGVHFQALPTSLHFASGQATHSLTVTPLGSAPLVVDEIPGLNLAFATDPQGYKIGASGQAEVLWVTQGGAEAALNFADWRNRHFPGNTNSALGSLDSDGDGNSNLMEYLAGSNPTRADATDSALSIHSVADGFELRWISIRALTDVRVGLEESAGLLEWRASSVGNGEKREWLPNGKIRRSYHFGPDPAARSRFFRMRPELLPTP